MQTNLDIARLRLDCFIQAKVLFPDLKGRGLEKMANKIFLFIHSECMNCGGKGVVHSADEWIGCPICGGTGFPK